jgi:hypothetical protein
MMVMILLLAVQRVKHPPTGQMASPTSGKRRWRLSASSSQSRKTSSLSSPLPAPTKIATCAGGGQLAGRWSSNFASEGKPLSRDGAIEAERWQPGEFLCKILCKVSTHPQGSSQPKPLTPFGCPGPFLCNFVQSVHTLRGCPFTRLLLKNTIVRTTV